MKDMLLGLVGGMIVGAVLARNCKPCANLIDDATEMVESKMDTMHKAMKNVKSSECECGCDFENGCDC